MTHDALELPHRPTAQLPPLRLTLRDYPDSPIPFAPHPSRVQVSETSRPVPGRLLPHPFIRFLRPRTLAFPLPQTVPRPSPVARRFHRPGLHPRRPGRHVPPASEINPVVPRAADPAERHLHAVVEEPEGVRLEGGANMCWAEAGQGRHGAEDHDSADLQANWKKVDEEIDVALTSRNAGLRPVAGQAG